MTQRNGALAVEDRFFDALLRGDGTALGALLTPDFLLVDVMTGSEVPGPALVDLVGSGALRFEAVERAEPRVRLYPEVALVTGWTRMRGRFGDQAFEVHSRYTHVYVQMGPGWRLASAQGTPIAASPSP